MCGIFGHLSEGPSLSDGRVKRALTALQHRGPDGEGIWRREGSATPRVVLGHRRLAIIDLSAAAAQPFASAMGTERLVFNGEIYNYIEVRTELRSKGVSFRTESDTEVLLESYRHWGEACVDQLNGMFAFAIWDEARCRLFLARDRFGEKPLYVVGDGGAFAFASEVKALVAAGLVAVELDDRALRPYVLHDELDGSRRTIYRNVQRVLPGESLLVERDRQGWRVSRRRYWRLPEYGTAKVSADDAAAEVRRLFEDSVRLRLRSDVPVGTSLSGGLDSSAVICTIQRLGAAGGQKAFSARMSDPRLDEGPFIQAVLRQTGIPGHEVVPDAGALAAQFPKLCWHMEEPFPATSMFAQFLVMALAREHGVTVLLDGQGADELLAGYAEYGRFYLEDLLRGLEWDRFRTEYRRLKAAKGVPPLSRTGTVAAFLPGAWSRRLRAGQNETKVLARYFRSSWLVEGRDGSDVTASTPYRRRLGAKLAFAAERGPLQSLLRYGDRNSMAWSRELRQPFLDHRLAEFVHALPSEHKISGPVTKFVMRQAMRGIVPDAVLGRLDKLGYQAPQSEWLGGTLAGWAEERLTAAKALLGDRLEDDPVATFRGMPRPLAEWTHARATLRLLTVAECVTQMRSNQAQGHDEH